MVSSLEMSLDMICNSNQYLIKLSQMSKIHLHPQIIETYVKCDNKKVLSDVYCEQTRMMSRKDSCVKTWLPQKAKIEKVQTQAQLIVDKQASINSKIDELIRQPIVSDLSLKLLSMPIINICIKFIVESN